MIAVTATVHQVLRRRITSAFSVKEIMSQKLFTSLIPCDSTISSSAPHFATTHVAFAKPLEIMLIRLNTVPLIKEDFLPREVMRSVTPIITAASR
jgi:hypothetical protein